MIVNAKDFKEKCKTLLEATNVSELSTLIDVVEINNKDKKLYLNVTNKNYYLSLFLGDSTEEDFRAVVNATTFLKLVSQLTTSDIEIKVNDRALEINGNGKYKLPLIYEGEELIKLSPISIDNETLSMNISSSILESIYKYNTKEIAKAKHMNSKPIQNLYYIDENGCITFTNSACTVDFQLEKPIKLLLGYKLVNLFKVLFNDDNLILKLGLNNSNQQVIYLEGKDIQLWGILNNESKYIDTYPAQLIRNSINKDYPYQVSLNKDDLFQAIGRLSLLNDVNYNIFELDNGFFTIYDINKNNQEVLNVLNEDLIPTYKYSFILETSNLKNMLNGSEKFLTLKFGDNQGVVVVRNEIKNLLPEAIIKDGMNGSGETN